MKALRVLAALGMLSIVLSAGGRLFARESLSIGQGRAALNQTVDVPLGLSSDEAEVQGFVMSFEWDGRKFDGVELLPATGAGDVLEDADIVETRVESSFMLFSVVMDLDGMGDEVIPIGEHEVGAARLRCICDSPSPVDVTLAFVDEKYAFVDGGPVQSNIVVIGGLSIGVDEGLELVNGMATCEGSDGEPGPGATCGGAPDENGNIAPAVGAPGDTVNVCYYYTFPPNNLGDESDRIEGFSLSVSYDCNLTCNEDLFSTEGSALEAVGAEFVEFHCDNDSTDGDDCELIVGVLIDAMPPFDGRKLPPTAEPSLLFCLGYEISENAQPDTCLGIDFVDGLNGRGNVPTKNLASINFFEQSFTTSACEVCVERDEVPFLRGDCNFNETVNVADAAAQVGDLFLMRFEPPCLDACDADDSGVFDLGDVVHLLQFLFVPGSPEPPPPGATPPPDFDPTPDDLSCRGN